MVEKQMSWVPNFPPKAVARSQLNHAIIDTLQQIDEARITIRTASRRLAELIRSDPDGEWQQRWKAFQSDGGISSDELCRWMVLHQRIRRTQKQRKHLRVIGGTA